MAILSAIARARFALLEMLSLTAMPSDIDVLLPVLADIESDIPIPSWRSALKFADSLSPNPCLSVFLFDSDLCLYINALSSVAMLSCNSLFAFSSVFAEIVADIVSDADNLSWEWILESMMSWTDMDSFGFVDRCALALSVVSMVSAGDRKGALSNGLPAPLNPHAATIIYP